MQQLVHSLVRRLSARTPQALIDDDLWRLNHHFYGPYALTGSLQGPSLVLGGRSGLYALQLAVGHPGQGVLLVEPDSRLREALTDSLDLAGVENVQLCASVAAGLEALRGTGSRLGRVRIARDHFSPSLITTLARDFRIEYLTGEFDEAQANPLWLHRISRSMAECFHWHNATVNLPMTGQASTGPDVSVVVPAYGVEHYLDQCLESLVSQTLDDLEIIVVDDGAKDRSGQIADEWARRDGRVRVIHQANAGCAAARSNGLADAKGLLVGLVDGDDWVDAPMFQALAESALRFNSDIAQCGFRHCYDSDSTWSDEREHFVLTHKIGEGNGLIRSPKDLIPLRPTIWRRLYRRDFLAANGIDFPRAIRRFDDLPFHFMTLALAERLSVVNACYYNYRQQRPGQDISVDDARLNVHFPIFRILKEFVRQHHTRELEEMLFMTQVASHQWALSVIQPALARDYRAAVKYELFEAPIALTPAELLAVVKRHGRRKAWWARGIQRQLGSGETAWLAVRDCSY